MSVTPNFSWPLIENTDFVTNLPADLEALADDIDADVWALDQAAIKKTIVDAKGDLIAATAADTVARVAVGTNGQVLTANSGAIAGVEWASPSTGANPVLFQFGTNRYVPSFHNSVASGGGITSNVTFYTPIFLPTCTLDRISIRSSSPFTTAGNVRLGIYNNSANNLPSTVLLNAGTVNVAAANTNYEITISQAITSGWYWLAINRQSGTFNLFLGSNNQARSWPIYSPDSNNLGDIFDQNAPVAGYQETGITGAFATAGTLSQTSNPVVGAVRIS